MNRFQRIASVMLVALPVATFAQTANTPGGSAATGTPLEQDKGTPAKTTSSTTSTTPSTTNPSGTTSHTGRKGNATSSDDATRPIRQAPQDASPPKTPAPGQATVPDPGTAK